MPLLCFLRDAGKFLVNTFPRPVAALFYVNFSDPEAGGTGHTIRVCRREGVPCIFQDSWGNWV